MNAKWNNPIRKFLFGIALAGLVLSLCLGSRGAPVARAQAAWTDNPTSAVAATPPLPQLAYGAPGWQQANTSGFGDVKDEVVKSLEVYNNQLYAGTGNYTEGGQIWRSSNGITWTAVSERGLGSGNVFSFVYDMIGFKGQLYAGIGNWTNGGVGGQVWRCTICDGSTNDWQKVVDNGFGSADNAGIANFAVFNNMLYASSFNLGKGVEIWRSSTGNLDDWTSVVSAGNGDANTFDAYLTAANGYLYAAVENSADGMEIWQTATGNEGEWNRIVTGGFGDATNDLYTGGLVVFGSDLYVGTGSDSGLARVYRYHNGAWGQVGSDGFGDPHNSAISGSLTVFDGALYAAVTNSITGMEVWSSPDGTNWSQVNTDGFGDSDNVRTVGNNSTAVFNNSLYLGVWNTDQGGEVWRTLNQVFLPLVMR